jgi:glycosyltransferase involved in cell wall biosynthesis
MIIENDHNLGLAESRNAGIRKADGKYLMFIDSDDFIAYGSIKKLVKTAQKTNADIVEYAFSEVSEQIEYNDARFINKLTTHSSDEVLENLFTHRKPGFARIEVWNKFYKSDLFKKIRFPDVRYAEDLAIIVDIYLDAKKITFLPERLYFYRKRPNGLTESMMTQEKLNDEALSLVEVRKTIKQRRPKLLGMANDFIINLGELSLGKLYNDSATVSVTKLLDVLKDE